MFFGRRQVQLRDQHAGFLGSELSNNVAAFVADEAVAVEALAAFGEIGRASCRERVLASV